MSFSLRSVLVLTATLLLSLGFAGCANDAHNRTADPSARPAALNDTTDSASVKRTSGTITAAPRNVREFAPAESAIASSVSADQVDLRKIFEDLGPDATLWYQHVQTLANPFFEGRASGTRGDDLAARYVEFYFKMYDLEPAFPEKVVVRDAEFTQPFSSYSQTFDFPNPEPEVNVFDADVLLDGASLNEETDFALLGNSGNGNVTAPLVFVGYGIEKGKNDYSSFDEKTDLTGRIAVLLRYEPLDDKGKSKWSSRFSTFSNIAVKMKNVADRHAAGIILVNPPGAADGKSGLETLKDSSRFGRRPNIPVFQLSQEVADRMMKQADLQHRDLMAWRNLADSGEMKTENLDEDFKVTLISTLDATDRLETQNIAAVLRGKGNLADQWIVIGGHYDHLGYGYTGAQPDNIGKMHPGADDNASGTAAMLIAARRLANDYDNAKPDENRRSILFIAFGAEEAGLFGSKHFVDNSPIANDATNLMINMDMVGRLRSNNLMVQGVGTAEGFDEMLRPIFESSGLNISAGREGRAPSDNTSFYQKNIPVLFLFTGEHAEYHKPTDRAYTVSPAGAIKVIDLLERITLDMAQRPQRLKFTQSSGGGDNAPARANGAKVSLGTMPDYDAQLETGMKVDMVRTGSSAGEAGIKEGDVLLTWNGQEIAGPRALSEFLMKHEPGDKIKIVLQRGEEELTVEVTLKARQAQ